LTDVERLFRTYNEQLVRYLTRRLGDRDWAEEVAQETFVRALRQETIVNERAWLFAVATNLVRDEARKDARRRRHLSLLAEQEKDKYVESEQTLLERAQETAMARKAIDALAERDRLALLMREEGLDYSEIAEALELSPGSVGTTLSRARRRLVESYEELQREREVREKNAAS
jgi:RNA polymerase sigma-70 factor (ECF subfamily)